MLNIEVHHYSSPLKCNYKRLEIHLKYLIDLKWIMWIKYFDDCVEVKNKNYILSQYPGHRYSTSYRE